MDDSQISELAKSLSHPLRLAFLRALREGGELSPVEFSRASEQRLGNVSYHVKALAEAQVVKVSETVQRRGAMEHRYVLRQPRANLVFELLDLLTTA